MTNAERQRAFRERLREKQPRPPPPQDELARQETAALKARIAQLEADLLAASARKPAPLPRTVEELKAYRRAAQEAKKVKRAAARAVAAGKYAGVDEKTLQERLDSAERQLAAARTRVRNLTAQVHHLSQKPPLMTKELHKRVLTMLHPDRVPISDPLRRKYERCFQDFSAVAFTFLDDERK